MGAVHLTLPVQVWVDVDEGIATLVTELNDITGIRTLASCQGSVGEGGPNPYLPYVMITWETDEAWAEVHKEFPTSRIDGRTAYVYPRGTEVSKHAPHLGPLTSEGVKPHWIKDFFTLPLDEMSGWIGDAWDMGFTFTKREDGLIDIYQHNDDFEPYPKPFMTVRDEGDEEGCMPQWRFVFLNYLASCASVNFIKDVLEGKAPGDYLTSQARNHLGVWYREEFIPGLGSEG